MLFSFQFGDMTDMLCKCKGHSGPDMHVYCKMTTTGS